MLRKIRDFGPPWGQPSELQPCRNPDHEFPSMIVLEPGIWEHECPGCGQKTAVTVPLVTCQTAGASSSFPGVTTGPYPTTYTYTTR